MTLKTSPFVDVDRDEDVVLLGRDRHLGRFDLEVRVAAVHVVRAELLEIALQRLARVAVVLLVPGEPVRRLQLEGRRGSSLSLNLRVADDVDLADLGALAFLDVDLDLHAVAGLFLDLGVDAHAVLAAAEVLVGEVLLHVLEHRAVEGLAGGKADVAQRLLQVLGLDVLVAGDLEALDRGALEHHHHQRVAIAAHLHVAEEAGGVQRRIASRTRCGVEMVADVHRQVVEDRAFGDALQAFDRMSPTVKSAGNVVGVCASANAHHRASATLARAIRVFMLPSPDTSHFAHAALLQILCTALSRNRKTYICR